MPIVKTARLLALVAGLLDFFTGLGLVFLPQRILPLMHVATPAGEALVYLRFVGAFVLAVGACYLLALVRGGMDRLRAALELTIPFRLSTGVFAAVALSLGWLSTGWVSVPATDFVLVSLQLWLLAKLRPGKTEPTLPTT
jgi:hypothetical protein